METKQKMFRFTPRTVDLLKIVVGLNQLSETEMLEVALEAVASPEALQLINSIHGDRVSRKSLRKPRTTKSKISQVSKRDVDNNRISSIIQSTREKQTKHSNIEVNEIDKKTQSIEELNLEEETPVLSLDTCDENLMEMYA